MLIALLFTIAKLLKQSKFPPIGKQINNMQYQQIMKYLEIKETNY